MKNIVKLLLLVLLTEREFGVRLTDLVLWLGMPAISFGLVAAGA